MIRGRGNRITSPDDVETFLSGIEYPATKDELIQAARDQNASDDVLEILDRIPDMEYNESTDVAEEIGRLE